MAQRVVRAKRKIALARIPFRLPEGAELRLGCDRPPRGLPGVQRGLRRHGRRRTGRRELCSEAVRLARLLADLAPDDPETLGLLSLVLLQDSRRAARVDAEGRLVPLAEQDRTRWDAAQAAEGAALVERALATGPLGPFQLQAAVAAVHAQAPTAEETDWAEIHALYRVHGRRFLSPVVTLNRAVALARLEGPEAGLSLVEDLRASGALVNHHRLASVRAHLLEESGRLDEARDTYSQPRPRGLARGTRVPPCPCGAGLNSSGHGRGRVTPGWRTRRVSPRGRRRPRRSTSAEARVGRKDGATGPPAATKRGRRWGCASRG